MADTHTPSTIVVGIDGSPSSELALHWATAEAVRRQQPLTLVTAWTVDYTAGMMGTLVPVLVDECATLLDEAAQRVRAAAPELPVTTHTVQRQPAAALIEASERAALVVVGARGVGGLTALLTGSTSMQVAAHAHCPVVVVRERPTHRTPGAVVVGLDGSEASGLALRYAFELAREHGLGVHAVHAWDVNLIDGTFAVTSVIASIDELEQEQRELVEKWTTACREHFPDVKLTTELRPGRPGDALVDASDSAELLVVGSRGLGGFRGLLLGSVSRTVLHRAHCPVAVVRAHHSHRGVGS